MSNCGCGSHCGSSCNCGCHKGPGIVTGPAGRCFKAPEPTVKLATFVYQEQLGDDTGVYAPQFGKFTNTVVWYQANDAVYIYDAEGQYTLVAKRGEIEAGDTGYITGDLVNQLKEALEEADRILQENIDKEAEAREQADAELQENIDAEAKAREEADEELKESIEAEATERKEADDALQADIDEEAKTREEEDNNLQSQLDAMAAATDVIDVVDTHADLEKYDTKDVHLNDIIKVLNDETHEGAITYYRWDGTEWNYVGSTGPYYTKAESDDRFGLKEDLEDALGEIAEITTDYVKKDNLKTVNGETLIGEGDLKIEGGAGGIAGVVPTYADLQSFDTTGLSEGATIVVTADETQGGVTSFYKYSEEEIPGGYDQTDNMMVNNYYMSNRPFIYYTCEGTDKSEAIQGFHLVEGWNNPEKYDQRGGMWGFLRDDLVPGYDPWSGEYSLQIERLDGEAPTINVINSSSAVGTGDNHRLVFDGRNYNITNGTLQTEDGPLNSPYTEFGIELIETTMKEGGLFNFRLYQGHDHPKPAMLPPTHWVYMGSTASGGDVKFEHLYEFNPEHADLVSSNVTIEPAQYMYGDTAHVIALATTPMNIRMGGMYGDPYGDLLMIGSLSSSSADLNGRSVIGYNNTLVNTTSARDSLIVGNNNNAGQNNTIVFGNNNALQYISGVDNIVAVGNNSHHLSEISVAVGHGIQGNVSSNKRNGTAIGNYAQMGGEYSVALGSSAYANNDYSVALGGLAQTTRNYEVSLGVTQRGTETTRYLAHVKAGENDTDAVNLAQVREMIAEGGGGSDVELLSAYSSTPTDSQAYSAEYVNSRLDGQTVKIGVRSGTVAGYAVAVGNYAQAIGNNSVTLGYDTYVDNEGAVALGAGSRTKRNYEVSIGSGLSNSLDKTRYLANVKAGELDTDAVNLGQMNAVVGDIQTILQSINGD